MELTNDFEVKVPIEAAWKILTDIERIAPCMPGAQLQEVEGDEYRGVVKVKVGPITAQYKGRAAFVEKDDAGHVAVLKADGRDTRGQGNANALITARLTEAGDSTKVSVHTDLTVTGKVAQFGRGVMADVSAKLLDQFVENLETMVLADGTEPSDSTDADEPSADTTDSAPDAVDSAPAAADTTDSADDQPEHVAEAQEEETTPAAVTSADSNGHSSSQDEPAAASATAPGSSPGGVRRIDQRASEPVDLLSTAGTPVAKRVVPGVLLVVALFVIWRWLRGRDD